MLVGNIYSVIRSKRLTLKVKFPISGASPQSREEESRLSEVVKSEGGTTMDKVVGRGDNGGPAKS